MDEAGSIFHRFGLFGNHCADQRVRRSIEIIDTPLMSRTRKLGLPRHDGRIASRKNRDNPGSVVLSVAAL
jgi:hypothetical protein